MITPKLCNMGALVFRRVASNVAAVKSVETVNADNAVKMDNCEHVIPWSRVQLLTYNHETQLMLVKLDGSKTALQFNHVNSKTFEKIKARIACCGKTVDGADGADGRAGGVSCPL